MGIKVATDPADFRALASGLPGICQVTEKKRHILFGRGLPDEMNPTEVPTRVRAGGRPSETKFLREAD